MPFLNWSEDFSVGVREIDEDHKRLVALLNDLHDAVEAVRGHDTLGKILEGLVLYVSYHFNHEESLFLQAQYPGFAAHKKEHELLTEQVQAVYQKFQSGPSATLPDEVLQFLKDWLYIHILESDKKFGAFIHEKGIAL